MLKRRRTRKEVYFCECLRMLVSLLIRVTGVHSKHSVCRNTRATQQYSHPGAMSYIYTIKKRIWKSKSTTLSQHHATANSIGNHHDACANHLFVATSRQRQLREGLTPFHHFILASQPYSRTHVSWRQNIGCGVVQKKWRDCLPDGANIVYCLDITLRSCCVMRASSANDLLWAHVHDMYRQTDQHAQTITTDNCFTNVALLQQHTR